MPDRDNMLDLLDASEAGPNPLQRIQTFIRFDWHDSPRAPWSATRHPAEHDRWTVKLRSGREIWAAEFHQFNLYDGLLAGIPTDTGHFALQAIEESRRLAPGVQQTLMLQPMFREFEHARRNEDSLTKHRVLPPVGSVAVFKSSAASGSDDAYSILKVVWFQEAFGLPSDSHTLDQLRAIDWEHEAASWMP